MEDSAKNAWQLGVPSWIGNFNMRRYEEIQSTKKQEHDIISFYDLI